MTLLGCYCCLHWNAFWVMASCSLSYIWSMVKEQYSMASVQPCHCSTWKPKARVEAVEENDRIPASLGLVYRRAETKAGQSTSLWPQLLPIKRWVSCRLATRTSPSQRPVVLLGVLCLRYNDDIAFHFCCYPKKGQLHACRCWFNCFIPFVQWKHFTQTISLGPEGNVFPTPQTRRIPHKPTVVFLQHIWG